MEKRDNKILIEIVTKVFGGKFANFFKKNLSSEFSSNYDFAKILYHTTNFEGLSKDALIENAKHIFYIMFYDSLMDYIFYKCFGIGNTIKKNIPIVGTNAISTGVFQYDNAIKTIFESIAYSKSFSDTFQKDIENKILDGFYSDLKSDSEFIFKISEILKQRPLNEGIFDMFNPEKRRINKIMQNTLDIIPKKFKARKEIIYHLKSGEINKIIGNVELYQKFVAREYVEPLNKIATPIIVANFYEQMVDKFTSEPKIIQDFFEIIIKELFTNNEFEKRVMKVSYSFFKQYAEFVQRKKVEKRKVERPKADPTRFNFKRK